MGSRAVRTWQLPAAGLDLPLCPTLQIQPPPHCYSSQLAFFRRLPPLPTRYRKRFGATACATVGSTPSSSGFGAAKSGNRRHSSCLSAKGGGQPDKPSADVSKRERFFRLLLWQLKVWGGFLIAAGCIFCCLIFRFRDSRRPASVPAASYTMQTAPVTAIRSVSYAQPVQGGRQGGEGGLAQTPIVAVAPANQQGSRLHPPKAHLAPLVQQARTAFGRAWWYGMAQGVECCEERHVVRGGESMGSIAGFLGVSLEDLRYLNPGVANPLREGQELRVPVRTLRVQKEGLRALRKASKARAQHHLLNWCPAPFDRPVLRTMRAIDTAAYRCQLALEWHPASHAVLMLGLMFGLVGAGGIVLHFGSEQDWLEAFYKAWLYIYNAPGADLAEERPKGRWLGGALFTAGLLLSALFVSVFTESIMTQVDVLRSGKSRVVESGHTLVLGWNNATVPLIRELAGASMKSGGSRRQARTVVVLADKEKDEMEADIARAIPRNEISNTRVVCRVGDPSDRYAQNWVAAECARSVVVLAEDDEEAEMADTKALRVVLATKGSVAKQERDRTRASRGLLPRHIDSSTVVEPEAARAGLPMVVQAQTTRGNHLIKLAGGDQVTTVDTRKLVCRHLVQCAVQNRGLASTMRRLQSFSDEEFYVRQWPQLVGRTFEEVCRSFTGAIPVGIVDENKELILSPSFERRMKKNEYVVVVANSRDGYRPLSAPVRKIETELPQWTEPAKAPGKYLILGWGPSLVEMMREMDNLVAPGSELVLASSLSEEEMWRRLHAGGIISTSCSCQHCHPLPQKPGERGGCVPPAGIPPTGSVLDNLTIQVRTTELERVDEQKKELDMGLGPLANPAQFDSIILLAAKYSPDGTLDAFGSDSSTLATILLLDELHEKVELAAAESGTKPEARARVVAEVVDRATKKLVKVVTREVDCVVGTEMMARVLAIASEDQTVIALWRDLLSADGNDVYLKPARRYVGEGEEISFWELAERARMRGEIALGYRTGNDDIELNPSNKALLREYAVDDSIVVISDSI